MSVPRPESSPAPFHEGDFFSPELQALARFRGLQRRQAEELQTGGLLYKTIETLEKIHGDYTLYDNNLWWACIHCVRDAQSKEVTAGGIAINFPPVAESGQEAETKRHRLIAYTLIGTEADLCAIAPAPPFTGDEAQTLFRMYQELDNELRSGELAGWPVRGDFTDLVTSPTSPPRMA